MRGSRSIYGDNTPLFIIDGIPGSYNQINPSDIETVDVLKDASSTAIYGSAGANGVVIITTKRGAVGKATVNLMLIMDLVVLLIIIMVWLVMNGRDISVNLINILMDNIQLICLPFLQIPLN